MSAKNAFYEKGLDMDKVSKYARALLEDHFLFCLHNPDGVVSESTTMLGASAERVYENEGLLPSILFAANESYRMIWRNPLGSDQAMSLEVEEAKKIAPSDHMCPKCHKGLLHMMETSTTRNRFWQCSRSPECDFISWGGDGGRPFGEEFGFEWKQDSGDEGFMTGFCAEIPERGLNVPITLVLLHAYDFVNRLADASLQRNFVFEFEGNSEIEYELKTKKIVVANSLVDMFDLIYLPRLQAQQESARPG